MPKLPNVATVVATQQKLGVLKMKLKKVPVRIGVRICLSYYITHTFLHVDFSLLLTTMQYETAFQLFISQGKHILKVVSQTTPPLLANTTAVHYGLCLSIVLNLNDLYFMALYLGVKIKTIYLGFIRSQVTLPVMGMNHMLAERT